MLKFVLDWLTAFYPFPTIFSKAFSYRVVESQNFLVRVKREIAKFAIQLILNFSLANTFNPFPHNDTFLMPLGNKPFETTVGKGEIARNEQFLLFPHCFLPVWITFCHFRQI